MRWPWGDHEEATRRPLGRGLAIGSWRQKNHSQMDPNHKSFRIKDFASRGRTCKTDVKRVLSSSGGRRWPPNRRKKKREENLMITSRCPFSVEHQTH